jgi:hypothetical protein
MIKVATLLPGGMLEISRLARGVLSQGMKSTGIPILHFHRRQMRLPLSKLHAFTFRLLTVVTIAPCPPSTVGLPTMLQGTIFLLEVALVALDVTEPKARQHYYTVIVW